MTTPDSGGVPLRVVSYNIHSRRDDPAALAAVVRAAAPDVLIVQEAPRRFRWRQKSATLAESFGLVVAAGGLPSLGNLLLTSLRVRVLDTRCQQTINQAGQVRADLVVFGIAPPLPELHHLGPELLQREWFGGVVPDVSRGQRTADSGHQLVQLFRGVLRSGKPSCFYAEGFGDLAEHVG